MFILRMNRRAHDPSFRTRLLFGFHYIKPGIIFGSIGALVWDYYNRYKKEFKTLFLYFE